MRGIKPAITEKTTIEGVINIMNSVGIIGLNDDDLAFLASQHETETIVNKQQVTLTDKIIAARSEISRRQTKSAIQSAEALVRMAEAQNKSAKGLTFATSALVIATIGLVVATIFH